MRLFGSDRLMSIMNRLGMEEGQVIEHPWVTRALEVAQKRVENYNFEIRKQLLEYDNVMNKQREAIYGLRREILNSDNVKTHIIEAIEDTVDILVSQYFPEGVDMEQVDYEGFELYLKSKFFLDLSPQRADIKAWPATHIYELIREGLLKIYEQKEQEVTSENLRTLEKIVLLNVIDSKWKDHLYAMDQMREGVGLRAYGQRDPLVEYKREGFSMFQQMYASINEEVAEVIFKVRPASPSFRMRGVFSSVPQQMVHNDFSGIDSRRAVAQEQAGEAAPEEAPPAAVPIRHAGPKIGRNDPCPCGSGKKYKKCCGKND